MLKRLNNLLRYGKWTDCQHTKEEIDHHYLVVCEDCGVCLR